VADNDRDASIRESAYQTWQRDEGIPVNRGVYVESLHTLDVEPWARIGQKGAFVNLADQQSDDGWLIEIAPGGRTNPMRHVFEMTIYVLEGRGATTFWQNGSAKQTVEWQVGSLFSVPLNCNYQHYNLDGQNRSRLFAVTNAPMIMNIYRSTDFVFDNAHVFSDRYALEDSYFSEPGRAIARNIWKTNFVPDVKGFQLQPSRRGFQAVGMMFSMANNQSIAHCSSFPPGVYKWGHRHGVGAHLLILQGVGYSLFWFEGEPRRRVDWKVGSLISPRELEYHQHFNTGPTPGLYLAFRLGELDVNKPTEGRGWNTEEGILGISYEREDPAIYDLYLEECALHGTEVILPRPQYDNAMVARA
jgi:mannose-6-phosphate isomerase-like protein (cupin superfamily)